jgi:hypothetical protein
VPGPAAGTHLNAGHASRREHPALTRPAVDHRVRGQVDHQRERGDVALSLFELSASGRKNREVSTARAPFSTFMWMWRGGQ